MTLLAAVLGLAVAAGLFLSLVMALAQRALVQEASPPLPDELPPLSILKPLKGVDEDLKENLRSLFRLDYPDYEIILGTEEADDPALFLAQRVAAEHPNVRTVVLSDASTVGFNPKVNNLSNLLRRARHRLVLISDSNVRVGPGYLKDLVAQRAHAGGGLVWSLFRGTNGRGLGGRLESLQLNVAVMGGLAAALRLLRVPCAVGKSMLLDRGDLERIGGFEFLGRFLGEDQICAEELAARGSPVTVTGHLIDNVLGRRSYSDFAGRHLRWARLRRHVHFYAYVGEALLNPVFLALVSAALLRTADSLRIAGLALAAMTVVDASTERLLGVRRPLWSYPLLELALSLSRGLLWFLPFFTRTVVWRGNRLAIGPRSEILLRSPAVPASAEGVFDTRHAPA